MFKFTLFYDFQQEISNKKRKSHWFFKYSFWAQKCFVTPISFTADVPEKHSCTFLLHFIIFLSPISNFCKRLLLLTNFYTTFTNFYYSLAPSTSFYYFPRIFTNFYTTLQTFLTLYQLLSTFCYFWPTIHHLSTNF